MAIWHGGTLDLAQLTATGGGSMPGFVGIEFVEAGDDWLKARMPVNERTKQPYGRLHGGASMVLIETAASVAGSATVDPVHKGVVGMEINGNHIRPAKDGFVYALAKAESLGRTTQVWTVRVTDADDRLVCLGRMTLAVIDVARTIPR
jgi:1,4-dihydroxy-2-naphthoyl-CoA hydrolase